MPMPEIRLIEIGLSPLRDFDIPYSHGYQVYSGILSMLDGSDEYHADDLGSFNLSRIKGDFGKGDRRYHNKLLQDNTYTLNLGVTKDGVFGDIWEQAMQGGQRLELANGDVEFHVNKTHDYNHDQLIGKAEAYDDPEIQMEFVDGTIIERDRNDISEVHPDRWLVFRSLLERWKDSAPDRLQFDFTRDDIYANVIGHHPNGSASIQEHNVVVAKDGKNQAKQHCFSGEYVYKFSQDTPEAIKNSVTALALFAPYCGIGRHVTRGFGTVEVTIHG